jgi:CarD family transcriptional regulator, regulator of rRNA transcription
MIEQNTTFQLGDQVIHWAHGLGEIIQLDEKNLSGHTNQYYVVKIRDMTLWVPINEAGECSLRLLTPERDFQNLFGILSSPGEPLSVDRFERQNQLAGRLKDGTLESICRVLRDLALHKRVKKMNENDKSIQLRAKKFLLDEWSIVLSVSIQQADNELQKLLGAGELVTT